MTLDNFCLLPA